MLKRIIASSGGLLLGELGSSLFLGVGKSGAIIGSGFDSAGAITAYLGAAATQGAIAGYGTYVNWESRTGIFKNKAVPGVKWEPLL